MALELPTLPFRMVALFAMVAGRVVVRNGKLTTLDEAAILAELSELLPAYLAEHAELERRNSMFEPYMAEIHRRATLQDIGLNRYQGDLPHSSGTNMPRA